MGWIGFASPPQIWAQIVSLRYLTSDPEAGIALPLHSFNPGAAGPGGGDLDAQLARLERLTGGRLVRASVIGLTVEFDFTVEAQRLQSVLLRAVEELEAGPLSAKHRGLLHQVMFGGWRRPLGREQGAFDIQDVAAAGSMTLQIGNAMRELRDGDDYSVAANTSAGYGMPETGKGVILGVVDFGCDFAHPSFCSEDRKQSRILELWDQNGRPEVPLGPAMVTPSAPNVQIANEPCSFGFGRVFRKHDIDRVLKEWRENRSSDPAWPYQGLGYDPHHHHYLPQPPAVAHGTCVLDAAASRDRVWKEDGSAIVRGVAPQADIVFVQVRTREQQDGRRVLDPNDVVDAVAYIFHVADARGQPCVVNLSLNTMSGPHDGDGHFERRLSHLMRSGSAGRESKGRAVVVAGGNVVPNDVAWRLWQHLHDDVSPGQPFEFVWNLLYARRDKTRNSLEIWYEAEDAWLQVSLIHKTAGLIATVNPGYAAEVFCNDALVGTIIGSRVRPAIQDNADLKRTANSSLPTSDQTSGRHVIHLSLEPHAAGADYWKISLAMVDAQNQPAGAGRAAIPFNVWLERDDLGQTGIARREGLPESIEPRDRQISIGTLSCGADPIVVAAYDASEADVQECRISASGPTAPGGTKPDISAPGANVVLIVSKTETKRQAQWGTSIAAPFVAGTIACMYEAAPDATLDSIRSALRESARGGGAGGPPSGWCPHLGWGRLNPKEAVRRIKSAMPPEGSES